MWCLIFKSMVSHCLNSTPSCKLGQRINYIEHTTIYEM
jgi:hypothetical protein